MTAEQQSKARDGLWVATYGKWYDSYFNELVANQLVSRWQGFNDPAKVVTAVTASGSVIAGWTLWSQPGFKIFWIIMAGSGALLSVISSSLTIPERIKDWTNTKAEFSSVRAQAEILLTSMKLAPDFDVAHAQKALENLMLRHNEAVNRMRNDFLHTKKLDLLCKQDLDALISLRKLWS